VAYSLASSFCFCVEWWFWLQQPIIFLGQMCLSLFQMWPFFSTAHLALTLHHSLAYPLSRSGEAAPTNSHSDILKAVSATEVWLSGAEHRYLSKPAERSPFLRLFAFKLRCGSQGTSLFSFCSKVGVPGQQYFGNKASDCAFIYKEGQYGGYHHLIETL